MIRGIVVAAALTSCSAANEYEPVTLASEQGGTVALTASAQHLYFAGKDGHAVRRVPLAGGAIEELANFPVPVGPIAFARGAVFTTLPRELIRIDPQTREVSVAAKLTAEVTSFAGDDESLFFSSGSEVYRLASGDAQPVVLDRRAPGRTIAVDATHVYMLGERLERVARAGGPREDLGKGLELVPSYWSPSLVVSDRWIYWTSTTAERIWRAEKSGGTATVLYEPSYDKGGNSAGDTPQNLAITAKHLWFTGASGSLWYAPLDGSGSPVRRVRSRDDEQRVAPIAAVDDAVYWAREGAILRATTP